MISLLGTSTSRCFSFVFQKFSCRFSSGFFSFEGLTEGEADGVTDCRKEGRVRACVRAGLEAETVLRSQMRCVYSERFHLWLGFLPRSLLAS